MATKNSTYPQTAPNAPSPQQYNLNNGLDSGLSPRKTFFVLVTVVGCIAILWPKIFYPMMFSSPEVPPVKHDVMNKDMRPGGCCGVVLDHEKYANASQTIGLQAGYRKQLNLMTGEMSLRQERPPHLRTGHIHPAMIERGRAIPTTHSVPILDRPQRAQDAPIIIDGRPGPIPGMRPPLGAGSVHQATQKTNSMGFIMPLYTVGIVAFFVYTVMKLITRKNDSPYPVSNDDPNFKQEVFRRPADTKIPNIAWKDHDTIVTAIQGLIDAADEQLNKQENSTDLNKNATEHTKDKSNAGSGKTNGHIKNAKHETNGYVENANKIESETDTNQYIEFEDNAISRLGTHDNDTTMKSSSDSEPEPEPQSIYLEGALPHESQILVADSQTTPESVDPSENSDEPAVILSSKMTLSLINLDPANDTANTASNGTDESNLDDKEDVENLHGVAK